MSVLARLVGFAAVLGLVLLGGLGLGRAVGPVADEPAAPAHGADEESPDVAEEPADDHAEPADDHAEPAGDHAEPGAAPGVSAVTGLAVSEDGYTLRPGSTELGTGAQEFRFTVEGPDGAPVTDYDLTHERELHLIVVRRDGSGFQHLHPERTADGSWSTPLTLDRPGAYRAYADFAPAGQPARTLATDLLVAGSFTPSPWPQPARTATADGYEVALDGHLDAGEESTLAFEVTRNGRPVQLERYLGASGHLVALREGDLGYLHVHADGEALQFATTAPSAGRYRLYLQFQVDGVVRTAELTVEAEEAHA